MSQSPQYDFSYHKGNQPLPFYWWYLRPFAYFSDRLLSPFGLRFRAKKKNSDFGTYFVIFISGISLVSMIYSIINHFRSYYYISMMNWSYTRVFWERKIIHSAGKNPIHQLRTKSDPSFIQGQKAEARHSGTGEKEMELAAIDSDKAEALRSLLIHRSHTIPVAVAYSAKHDDLIFQLGFVDLIRAGFVENHLKSGGLIFVFYGGCTPICRKLASMQKTTSKTSNDPLSA